LEKEGISTPKTKTPEGSHPKEVFWEILPALTRTGFYGGEKLGWGGVRSRSLIATDLYKKDPIGTSLPREIWEEGRREGV